MLVLPLPTGNPYFSVDVELDTLNYVLEFAWNERASAWFVSMTTSGGDVIFSGRKLVLDWPLWFRVVDNRLPGGILLATDTSGVGLEAGVNDLGARVEVAYVTAEEVLAL